MTHRETLLLLGATGTVGSALVRALLACGFEGRIRCTSRDPQSKAARALAALGDNVEVAAWDAVSGRGMEAFTGVTRVFVLPPIVPEMLAWHEPILKGIKAAGTVRLVVKQSVMGARTPAVDPQVGLVPRLHGEADALLKSAGVPTTTIHPTIFAQHLTLYPWVYERGTDELHLPTGEGRLAFLDARDIAALAAAVLCSDDPTPHHGQAYQLTGPTAATAAEIAGLLSDVRGAKVVAVDDDADAYRKRMAERGADPWMQALAERVYQDAREGWLSRVATEDFERIVGRKPTSLRAFVQDHVEHFRGGPVGAG